MTCTEADRLWHDILDARGEGHPGRERLIAAHSVTCPRCRDTSSRYLSLRVAIATLGPPPIPSGDLANRFLVAARVPRPRPGIVSPWRGPWVALATAATLLTAVWLGGRSDLPRRPEPRRAAVRIHLASALADATSATLDLARGVSAPAARIGLDVLDLDGVEFARAEIDPGEVEPTEPTSDLLRSMGERIDAGARPFSGTARHAFGFLLPTRPDADRLPISDDDGL